MEVILCIGVTYGHLVTSPTETFILDHRFEVKTCLGVCHTCYHIRPMVFVLLGRTFDCENGTDCRCDGRLEANCESVCYES